MKIAWVTDSASCIDLQWAREHHVHVIPLHVIFEGKSYKDMIEMDEDEFYRLIWEGKSPSTSQPSVGEFVELYNQLHADGYDAAIAIHVSAKLSGTIQASRTAAEMVDLPVYIIDSGLVAKPMMYTIEAGLRLFRDLEPLQDILNGIKEMRDRVVGYFMINDLQFLHRGGRLSATSALMGTLLQVKPILLCQYEKLDLFSKVRTHKKAKEFIFDLLHEDAEANSVQEISVIHADHLEEAKVWLEQLKERFSHIPVMISTLGTVVGSHSGPRAIGIAWRK